MKRLMVAAAVAAISAGLFAADGEVAPAAKDAAAKEAPAAVAEPVGRGARAGATFDRSKFEEHMKRRRMERRGKVVDILKAAGIPAEKADAVADEIDGIYVRRSPQRPQRQAGSGIMRRQPRKRPQAENPVPPQAAPAKAAPAQQ